MCIRDRYNTLSAFLSSFPDQENASALMRAFVGNLERSSGLEDGVDVADSYASIVETNKPLADEMLQNVMWNYDRNVSRNNKRGTVIYNLLQELFLSADSTKNIDLTKELGVPPVYLSLIHISEPTRLLSISYAVFCLK